MTPAADGSLSRVKYFAAAKSCDFCKSAAALLFCRPHSAFMCLACDAKVHTNGTADKHARVWMCEVCEQAPAAVTCKADAAVLCVTCDRDIHCANPLANRHDRVPVVPFYDSAENIVLKSTAEDFLSGEDLFAGGGENCYIPDSWISPPPPSKLIRGDTPDLKSLELLLQDSDQFLDFDKRSQPYSDSVVPVQAHPAVKPPVYASEIHFEIDFTRSNIGSYNDSYPTQSLSHSVSSSSMEVGVVPDGSSPSESSYPLTGMMNSGGNQGMDREARVLRYREKRKNRKFEKTIRYASRKAYAETRPRVKGRFAKRTDADWIHGGASSDFVNDARYGVVPSF